ncbi:hypothetical protein N657DRAFT_589306 [Parathielavia appendiculata]|uniref:D-xylose 1-dehydrogenase (NADP(+), D-xylono-1,5-lactone-forming) n=1 Tax=Parathielavia appendiculata TaxID=2587402 RepID=A0AAN6U738_9PEZI|nr:hypothetical protein N657DRAFT_589306 [Parathielavia appendiculata]
MAFPGGSKAEDKIITPFKRFWRTTVSQPSAPPKANNPIRFGILFGRDLDTSALIFPAKHHPGAVLWGVACTDSREALQARSKHGFRYAYESYEHLLNDPTIEAVYIEVGIQHRLEWALRALDKKKHVLLDTPCAGCPHDAFRLFNSPLLRSQEAPVILEVAPYRFHPSWLEFERHIDRPYIEKATVKVTLPTSLISKTDTRFRREQSGGAQLDLTYAMFMLRSIFGTEPSSCDEMAVRRDPAGPARYDRDYNYKGKWRFPTTYSNGQPPAVGEVKSTVKTGFLNVLPFRPCVVATVVHRKKEVINLNNHDENKVEVKRTVTLSYYVSDASKHEIEIVDKTFVTDRANNRLVSETAKKRDTSAYTLDTAPTAEGLEAKPYWTAPMYQLDAFLQRIHQSPNASPAWVSGDDSINQMNMMGGAYVAMGRPLPPNSTFYFDYQMEGPAHENGQPQAQGNPPVQDQPHIRIDAASQGENPIEEAPQVQGQLQPQTNAPDHKVNPTQGDSQARGHAEPQTNPPSAEASQAQGSSHAQGQLQQQTSTPNMGQTLDREIPQPQEQSQPRASNPSGSSAQGSSHVQGQSQLQAKASDQVHSQSQGSSHVQGQFQPHTNLPNQGVSPVQRNPFRQARSQQRRANTTNEGQSPAESSSQAPGPNQSQINLVNPGTPGAYPGSARSSDEDEPGPVSMTQIQAQPMI